MVDESSLPFTTSSWSDSGIDFLWTLSPLRIPKEKVSVYSSADSVDHRLLQPVCIRARCELPTGH